MSDLQHLPNITGGEIVDWHITHLNVSFNAFHTAANGCHATLRLHKIIIIAEALSLLLNQKIGEERLPSKLIISTSCVCYTIDSTISMVTQLQVRMVTHAHACSEIFPNFIGRLTNLNLYRTLHFHLRPPRRPPEYI